MNRYGFAMCLCSLGLAGMLPVDAHASDPPSAEIKRGIPFAEIGSQQLLLDLYLPTLKAEQTHKPPLVIWVHGGAWRKGSRDQMPLGFLVEAGFAVASVDYRLSPVAKFPAQVQDIKAAVRFLRAHAHRYGYDATRIGIAGSSAGGHLAALVGVTNGHDVLEGSVGDHTDESSQVHAIVDYYGPTNVMTILKQSTPHGLSVRVPALELLLGGQPDQFPELARLASPVFHVDADDPPLLLIHGDQDPQVPINQSHELQGRYENSKLKVHFEVVHGGEHGGPGFFDEQRNALVIQFLTQHLRNDKP